jgi:alpha-amylase
MVKNMQPRAGRLNATEVLRNLPQNEAFYFFEDIDKYTGKNASSLVEFCEMTKTVDKKSIVFHFKRHDFERWIKGTLRDSKLAKRISNIKKTKSEERLRTQIYKVSKKRLEELNNRLHKKRR